MVRHYSCESATCSATIYDGGIACTSSNSSTYLRFEAFNGIGPYIAEFDATGDGVADFSHTFTARTGTLYLNVPQNTLTVELISVIDESNNNEICDVSGTVTLSNQLLDAGKIGNDQEICLGDTALDIYTTVGANSNGTINNYQWRERKLGTYSWTTVQNGGSVYSPGALTESKEYQVYVTSFLNGRTCSDFTNIIQIFVGDASQAEICDGLDNDCNGLVDDGLPQYTYYADTDNDGYGDPNVTYTTCESPAPLGWSTDNTDCNDNCNSCYPGALDLCNNIDEDCDGIAYENCICPDITVNSIIIDTLTFTGNYGTVYYTAEIENIGTDTAFLSQRGVQHYYSDDNIIGNGDESPAGGWAGPYAFGGVDTLLVGQKISFSLQSSNIGFASDSTPHLIIEIIGSGFDCDGSNDDFIELAVCPNCLNCDEDVYNITWDLTPKDSLSDYKWSAKTILTMDSKVLVGSSNDTFVDLTAGNSIELLPGFETPVGTRTFIYIQACNPSTIPPSSPADNEQNQDQKSNAIRKEEVLLESKRLNIEKQP